MDPRAALGELRRLSGGGGYAVSGVIVTPRSVMLNGAVVVEGGRIVAILDDASEASKDVSNMVSLPYIIAPGFVDIHIHGGFGVDVYDVLGSPERLQILRAGLASRGTTSFCLTLFTADASRMAKAAAIISSIPPTSNDGSRVVGVHFEGPFISVARAGAQDRRHIVEPNMELADKLVNSVLGEGRTRESGVRCVFTMAPEVNGALDVARTLSERGVVVSAGHTNADYDTAIKAFHSGFTHVTHLYNAMRAFGHRDPGVIGAALDSPDVSVDLIVDSHHVDPRVVRSTAKVKGRDRTAIISDALLLAGQRAATEAGGLHVEGGVARLADGTIAGSISLQEAELLVGVGPAGIPLRDVIGMLSETPANIIGRPDLGSIRVGGAADFVFLDRRTLGVVGSVVGGNQVFMNTEYRPPEVTGQPTLMYQEILEQPSKLAATLKSVRHVSTSIARDFARKPPRMVYIVGSGSSYHAAVSARYAFKRFTQLLSAPVPASEFPSWVGDAEAEGGVVIAVSQSGESSDTLGAVEKARQMGLRIVGVTNNPLSSLAKQCDWVVALGAGSEKAVTATKSFTCSLLALYAVAVEVGHESGHLGDDDYYNAKVSLNQTPGEVATQVYESEWRAYTVSKELVDAKAVFTMGSGVTYPVALEAALKLKEAANIYAEGFALREFLHGPIQLLGDQTAVLVFEPPTRTQDLRDTLDKFAKYGSRVITVSPIWDEGADIVAHAPLEQEFYPVVATVPAQLLALYSSLRRGLNPDSPSKLSKVVR
jgi:N-acetylglucosamine-6-phosphate deacetylase